MNPVENHPDVVVPSWFLILTALVCGALIMVIEVLGSRVIGPFFGVSLFVWSSLIAVTMIALAAGYALGGRLADRHAHPDWLYGLIFAAGVATLLIPLVKGPVLQACMHLGLRLGAFVSSLALFGPSLMLLGCVSPFLIKVAASTLHNIGRTVGTFYALSTIGSVLGTILTGFVLIIYLGVSAIFLLVGGVLVVLAVAYFTGLRRRPFWLLSLFLPLLLWQAAHPGPVSALLPSGTRATVVAEVDSYVGNLKVVDYTFGAAHTRELLLDGIVQSGIDMRTGTSIYPYYYLLGILPYSIQPKGRDCLVIGLGGGTIPNWYQERGIRTDVVDIDPEIVRLAGEYFDFHSSGDTIIDDARNYLTHAGRRYDYIVMDVFSGESAPPHIISREAVALLGERLRAGGVLAINFLGRLRGDTTMTAAVVKTLQTEFDQVELYPNFDPQGEVGMGNIGVIAYRGAPVALPADLIERFPIHPMARDEVRSFYRWRAAGPDPERGFILRDDYNPIDCYDHEVREFLRRNMLAGTPWDILTG